MYDLAKYDACDLNNPHRSPAWVWERAELANLHSDAVCAPNAEADGEVQATWIKDAQEFKTDLKEITTPSQLAHFKTKFPAIYWAYHFFQRDENTSKYEIEARILAGQTDLEVASTAGLSPKVVEAYEALFFNVREKVIHPGYIINVVIGTAAHRGIQMSEYDLLWKMLAYAGGPGEIDDISQKMHGMGWATNDRGARANRADRIDANLERNALFASSTMHGGRFSAMAIEIMNMYFEHRKIQTAAGSQANQSQSLLDGVQNMLGRFRLIVGGRTKATGRLSRFDAAGIELSATEQLKLARGEKVDLPDAMEFPPPPDRLDGANT